MTLCPPDLSTFVGALRAAKQPTNVSDVCHPGGFRQTLYTYALTQDIDCLVSPVYVNLLLTRRCVAKCLHCSASAGSLDLDEMSTPEWTDLIVQLGNMEVNTVVFSGGEPFLRDDIYELIRVCKSKRMFVTVLTSAAVARLDVPLLRAVLDLRTDLINVSIDGPNAEIHDHQRGAPVFSLMCEKVSDMVSAGIKVMGNMTVTPHNESYILETFELAQRLGLFLMAFNVACPVGRGANLLDYDADGMLETARKLLGMSRKVTKPVVRNNLIPIPYDVDEICHILPPDSLQYFPRYRCVAGTARAVVDANGDVFPCTFMLDPRFCAGNVRQASFGQIWRQGHSWAELRKGRALDSSGCGQCEYLNVCKGECPAAAFSRYGTINAPDGRCRRGYRQHDTKSV